LRDKGIQAAFRAARAAAAAHTALQTIELQNYFGKVTFVMPGGDASDFRPIRPLLI
jgi:hypothetical protein